MKHGKLLGQGYNAKVYELTETTVLRKSISTTDGFRAIHWMNDDLRAHFKLPVIIDYDKENDNWAIVEKLYPIRTDIFEDLTDFDWECINVFRQVTDHINGLESKELKELINKAIQLFYRAVSLNIPIRDLDLGRRNIMQRQDGALVLTDPFGNFDI